VEALIAAIAVGIVVGGVSTWISQHFEREKRREVRQEQRDRDLREMIEAMMQLARTQSSGLREFQTAPWMLGISVEDVRQNQLRYIHEAKALYPKFFWRPHRVKDERLRTLASDLQQANTEASLLVYDKWKGGKLAPANWDAEVNRVAERIDDLLQRLDHRLDELGW
jgi:hypothetical protein